MGIEFATKSPEAIKNIFKIINDIAQIFNKFTLFLWTFPTNISSYRSIPIIGHFPLFIILIGLTGIFLSIKFGFTQIRYFPKSIKIYHRGMDKGTRHYSPAFILSLGARIGSTNILGVTSAIAIGGPGALFWIWVFGIFSMGIAFVEATLTQIFKGKKEDIFYGGLPYYGQKLWKNNKTIGALLAIAYICYAFCSAPIQGYNAVSAMGSASEILLNAPLPYQGYNFICIALVLITALMIYGSIHRVQRACNILVPIMLTLYIITFTFLLVLNFDKIPNFFYQVFIGAFNPKTFISGTIGATISIGAKTAISSNEAGMGTISFADAVSNCSRPVRQGFVASLNVFIDTFIICSITGFIIIAGGCYNNTTSLTDFNNMQLFTDSLSSLTYPSFTNNIKWIMYLCLALFSFTTLICEISFCDLSVMKITRNKNVRYGVCFTGLFITIFGIACSLMGLSLNNLWALSDLATIFMTIINIPLLILGSKYVMLSLKNYEKHEDTPFTSTNIGSDIKFKYWDKKEELDEND